MKFKKIYVICATVLASIAIIVSACLVFLGNDVIKEVPNGLEIEKIGSDYYLVAEYNPNYKYQFKLEQKVGTDTIEIDVNSNKNSLKIGDYISVVAGGDYKFSVCFATENGAGNGGFSQTLEWRPTWMLDSIDYSEVKFNNETQLLTWRDVYLADRYVVQFIDLNGKVVKKTSNTNSLSLSSVAVGNYQVYIFAESTNVDLQPSVAGEGMRLKIERKNVIKNALVNPDNSIRFYSTQKIEAVEVFEDGQTLAVFELSNPTQYGLEFMYEIPDAKIVLNDCTGKITLKSCACDYVFASEITELNVMG